MDRAVTGHTYRTVDVPVAGGDLRVAIWNPEHVEDAPAVVAIHGVTSSHLAWQWVAEAMPGVRIVAPDLRGRGRSNELEGPAGMAAHAEDLAAVFAHLELDPTVIVGHSMGAFVAVVFAHRHPDLVTRLLLVDGGLPLAAPAGLSADELVAAILGPTAERLGMRFADTGEYFAFWEGHPAFEGAPSPALERYFAYDLVPDGDLLRPATSYETTAEDTVDLNTGTALTQALAVLPAGTAFITVPRGLQNEAPGLYPPAHLEGLLETHQQVEHERWEGLNHYSVVMAPQGAHAVAARIRSLLD